MKQFFAWILSFLFLQPMALPEKRETLPPLVIAVRAELPGRNVPRLITDPETVEAVTLLLRRISGKTGSSKKEDPIPAKWQVDLLLSDGTEVCYRFQGSRVKEPDGQWAEREKNLLGLLLISLWDYSAQKLPLHA